MNTAPLFDTLRALTDDAMMLVRKEIELAKVEIDEKIGQAQQGLIFVFAGLLGCAVAVFLFAQGLVAWLAIHVGPAAAAFIIGAVVLIAGLIALFLGASYLKAKNLAPRRTMRSASESATRLKETLHDKIQ